MKMVIAALVILASSAPVSAQAYIGISPILSLGGNSETPTMQRQKLVRAKALRVEAVSLLAQDGGTLTDEHQRYVQRKVRNILSNNSSPMR